MRHPPVSTHVDGNLYYTSEVRPKPLSIVKYTALAVPEINAFVLAIPNNLFKWLERDHREGESN